LTTDLDLLQAKIDLYVKMGRFDVAENLVKAEIDAKPDHLAYLYHALGLIFHRQSRFKEAIDYLKKALEVDPSYTEASLNLTTTLADMGFYEEAVKVYDESKKYHRLDPRLPTFIVKQVSERHFKNGSAYESMGLIEQAYHEYRQALNLAPENTKARFAIAKLYIDQGQIEKGFHELGEVLRVDPDHNAARSQLGLLYFKAGQKELAKDHWRKALQNGDLTAKSYLKISET
jgi:tetratricopeptide (TPR) repeat protein